MARPRRLTAAFLLAALVMAACGTDGDTSSTATSTSMSVDGPMIGSVDDLKAVRLRNFNIGKSINKTVGKASG